MRTHQLPLDERPLWEHLQAGEFEKTKTIVDYYYSKSTPDGFDNPSGITKIENLIPTEKKLPGYIRNAASVGEFLSMAPVYSELNNT